MTLIVGYVHRYKPRKRTAVALEAPAIVATKMNHHPAKRAGG
jgi:hypothetical protein